MDGSIPSCGLVLIRSPGDYWLTVFDGDESSSVRVTVRCHRAVLVAHSPVLRSLCTDSGYFEGEVKVPVGHVPATLELLQYMYLKDPALVHRKREVLDVACLLRMPHDHFYVRMSIGVQTRSPPNPICLVFQRQSSDESDEYPVMLVGDWVERMRVHHSVIRLPERQVRAPAGDSVVRGDSDDSGGGGGGGGGGDDNVTKTKPKSRSIRCPGTPREEPVQVSKKFSGCGTKSSRTRSKRAAPLIVRYQLRRSTRMNGRPIRAG